MPPRPVAASRRAKRVIQSDSPSSPSPEPEPEPELEPIPSALPSDDEVEEVDEDEEGEELDEVDDVEEDAEGEFESEEEAEAVPGRSGMSSVIASEDMELDDLEDDADADEVDEQDAEGEADDAEDADADADADELEDDEEEPESEAVAPAGSKAGANGLRIKLKFGGGAKGAGAGAGSSKAPAGGAGGSLGKRPARAAAKKAGKRAKRVAMEADLPSDEDPLLLDDAEVASSADFGSRATSPSKLTARQRAKGNKDLQEALIALPNDGAGKKQIVLTEAERQQKREETARRRKRQSEQKLQDEQDQTINRLLRAQTGRSRAKLDNPSPALGEDATPGIPGAGGTGASSPSKRPARIVADSIRWTSTVRDGAVLMRVAAPRGKEDWIRVDLSPGEESLARQIKSEDGAEAGKGSSGGAAGCDAPGCGERRKYRSTKRFEAGGCSVEHLKLVNERLAAEGA